MLGICWDLLESAAISSWNLGWNRPEEVLYLGWVSLEYLLMWQTQWYTSNGSFFPAHGKSLSTRHTSLMLIEMDLLPIMISYVIWSSNMVCTLWQTDKKPCNITMLLMGKSTISMTILGMMVIPARNWTSASHLAGFSKLPMGEWKLEIGKNNIIPHLYGKCHVGKKQTYVNDWTNTSSLHGSWIILEKYTVNVVLPTPSTTHSCRPPCFQPNMLNHHPHQPFDLLGWQHGAC